MGSIYRKMFKHKLGLASTTPNNVIENYWMYNCKKIEDNQIQSKITNFIVAINNTNILGNIYNIRFKKIQMDFWLEQSILKEFPYTKSALHKNSKYKGSFIIGMIKLINENNFQIDITKEIQNIIEGGNLPIRNILKKDSNNYKIREMWRNNRIMYFEQLISQDKIMLMNWNEIKTIWITESRNNKTYNFGIFEPKWFIKLSKKVLMNYNKSRRIKEKYLNNIKMLQRDFVELHNPPEIKVLKQREWITYINNEEINIGKLIKRNEDKITIQHWIREIESEEKSPSQNRSIIKECTGCSQNDFSLQNYNAYNCIKEIKRLESWELTKVKKLTKEKKYEISPSFYQIKDIIHNKLDTHRIINPSSSQPEITLIEQYVEDGPTKDLLSSLKYAIHHSNNKYLEFYTDGSMKQINNIQTMGSAFIQTSDNFDKITFTASSEKWASPLKAELISIVSVLLILNKNSKVKIFTDCQSIITYFYSHKKEDYWSNIRNNFKNNNNLLWTILFDIIITNNIEIELIKVKAHSNDYYNNIVDTLAKRALVDPKIEFKTNSTKQIKYWIKWNNYSIEKNLRSFLKIISYNNLLSEWLSLYRNKSYLQQDINWKWTMLALNYGRSNQITDNKLSNTFKRKIKFIFEDFPTIEKLKQFQYNLYKNKNCFKCNQQKETFLHLWHCQQTISIMEQIIIEAKQYLQELIIENLPDNHKNKSNNISININNILNWNSLLINHKIINLLKGLIDNNIVYILKKYVIKDKIIEEILGLFIEFLQFHSFECIWKERCELVKEKEKKDNITKKDKKLFSYNSNLDNTYKYKISFDLSHNLVNYIYNNGNLLDFERGDISTSIR
ncbi:hypothetical protein C1645_740065 [Glomus cerebriforme]|uniref:RNase H type-1 domain-containing protein n=1 Tax=Glomus cerebriforme TaxID=658196 RepID=A0A397SN16_9GLOM|nr:hypothetical protein C1645_740065 [Glomus cerebriforme]